MHWKQFGGWVTDLKFKPFKKAQFKLTAFYILMIAVILSSFSLILYFQLSKNIRDDLEGDGVVDQARHEVVESAIDHIELTIVLVDASVLIIFSGLAYVLAGKTLRPIEQALEAQKKFSSDASHEFRTPLSIIKHDVEVALKNPHLDEEETRSTLKSNLEEVNHLSSMVEQLLKLSRSDNGLLESKKDLVDLAQLVKAVAAKLAKLARLKNIRLELVKVDAGRVVGQATALQEMLVNLLQNAIDYTPQNGSIEVIIQQTGKYMEIVIKDTGIGIDGKDLPHIFKRFYKADNSRTLRSNSSGLGLSIVQDIVNRHEGIITIESEPQKGTTVKVRLPTLLT